MHTYEPTPTPKAFGCKMLAWGVGLGLWGAPLVFGLLGWWKFHWSAGLLGALFGYLLAGIISSKMRQVSIPGDQREISFTPFEIARWYVVRHMCCDA